MNTSWLEISRSALRHNVQTVKKHLGPKSQVFAVIKGNAYGHGQKEIVSLLHNDKNIAGFMVFELAEALLVRQLTAKPIAVLGFTGNDKKLLPVAAKQKIILPILNLADARRLSRIIKGPWQGHIKIDIGTGRLGIPHQQATESILKITSLPKLRVLGVFSHFADSENADQAYTNIQYNSWKKLLTSLSKNNILLPLNHIACTAAMLRHPEYTESAVRLGLGLYGLDPYPELPVALKPVLAWKTTVLQSRLLAMGESVGYNRTYRAKKPQQLITIPVGYYDGYDRRLSNRSEVIINDKKYPIAGQVCMNVCMIITPVKPLIKPRTVVTLIGQQAKALMTADELASLADTINYEIVTRINPLLPRIIVS